MTAAPASTYRSFGEQSLHYFIRDHAGLPDGPVASPAAWRGEDLSRHEAEWRESFSSEELDELEGALDSIEARRWERQP